MFSVNNPNSKKDSRFQRALVAALFIFLALNMGGQVQWVQESVLISASQMDQDLASRNGTETCWNGNFRIPPQASSSPETRTCESSSGSMTSTAEVSIQRQNSENSKDKDKDKVVVTVTVNTKDEKCEDCSLSKTTSEDFSIDQARNLGDKVMNLIERLRQEQVKEVEKRKKSLEKQAKIEEGEKRCLVGNEREQLECAITRWRDTDEVESEGPGKAYYQRQAQSLIRNMMRSQDPQIRSEALVQAEQLANMDPSFRVTLQGARLYGQVVALNEQIAQACPSTVGAACTPPAHLVQARNSLIYQAQVGFGAASRGVCLDESCRALVQEAVGWQDLLAYSSTGGLDPLGGGSGLQNPYGGLQNSTLNAIEQAKQLLIRNGYSITGGGGGTDAWAQNGALPAAQQQQGMVPPAGVNNIGGVRRARLSAGQRRRIEVQGQTRRSPFEQALQGPSYAGGPSQQSYLQQQQPSMGLQQQPYPQQYPPVYGPPRYGGAQ